MLSLMLNLDSNQEVVPVMQYFLYMVLFLKFYLKTKHLYCCFIDYKCEFDRKEGNVLFNDALNSWLYGVRHMVKDHSDSEKGNPLPPHRLLFPINIYIDDYECYFANNDYTSIQIGLLNLYLLVNADNTFFF